MSTVMKQFQRFFIFALFLSLFISISQRLHAQALPADRVTAPVDDRNTVLRPGNRHPLARPEYDAGVVSPEHRMERMVLVLQPDPSQQLALQALLSAQQD